MQLRFSSRLQGRARCAPAPTWRTSVRRIIVAARKEEDSKQTDAADSEKFSKVLEELKNKGMTPATAKTVLKKWSDMGAQTPEELRKLLLTKSLRPISGLLIQAALDSVAAFGGFFLGDLSGKADFSGNVFVQLIGYFLGCYYFLQVVFELGAAVALVVGAYKYQANTADVLRAVQQIAGPGTGVSVVDKAQLAVNTLKVLQTLDSIFEILKGQFDGIPNRTTLQNLSAYLTLVRAKDLYGFDPAQYGMSEQEAGNIALVFSKYDSNENGRLELSELKALCLSLGKELDDAELKEALRILDANGNGTVEFGEFVEWWVKELNRGGRPATDLKATQV